MDFGINQAFVEEQFYRFRENPHAVEADWRKYFEKLSEAELAELLHVPPPGGATLSGVASPVAPPRASTSQSFAAVPELPPLSSYVLPAPVHKSAPVPNGLSGLSVDASVPAQAGESAYRVSSMPPLRSGASATAIELQERVTALVNGYRLRGHRFADLDPLGLTPRQDYDLSLDRFGLADVDPQTRFITGNFGGEKELPLGEFVRRLEETYCRHIGAEFRNIEEPEVRAWLQTRMEATNNRLELTAAEQERILSKLIDAEAFEQFLHTKFVGAKRFSLEGAESIIPMLDLVVEACGRHKVEEVVIGMAHRGRLNVLANIMDKHLEEIFAGFEDQNPERLLGRGDVKYHMGYSSNRVTESGHSVHLTLSFNPSHLEFVNPVVEGRVRAKQDRRSDHARKGAVPLLIHGDAAFIGQGVVAETINLAGLRGYSTGGTIHIVINNQIGFTTTWEDSRSTRYCTDIVRMLRCPVFHVNGEDPEAVAQVVQLAVDFRQRYGRDSVIDLYCYRRYGHNEADEPRFTQPLMYGAIDRKPTVREEYVKRVIEMGALTQQRVQEIEADRRKKLEEALQATRSNKVVAHTYAMQGLWNGYTGGRDLDTPDVSTAVPDDRLRVLVERSNAVPDGFNVHPKLIKLLEQRRAVADGTKPIDWGTAETLAYASLVIDGTPVRLSGQDARRGTFSHRHAVLHDTRTGRRYTPLAFMTESQARFEVWDSPLSEAGVLGFEYGYSLDCPDGLVIWEAQFGDFCNAAQVIIDQFICSSEDKWNRLSGLVCLLPHGFEGQGPEHSSARLERWLNLCAEDNMQVCNLSTPAQFFHAMRRQVLRKIRKPLIIMSPKSLLRHPKAASVFADLSEGEFHRVIPDTSGADPKQAKRVILCSGKIYYELDEARIKSGRTDIAIIRIEQLYPLRSDEMVTTLAPYADGTELLWVQEEPFNMGAWYYMRARLPEMIAGRLPLRCVSRPESASPATGSHGAHKIEQAKLIGQAIDD